MSETSNLNTKNKTAYIVLFITPILWGSTFITAKIMIETVNFLIMQGVRHVFALFGFLPFIKSINKIDKYTLTRAMITGGCNATAMLLQTIGLQTTTASKTGFITALYIVFVPLIAFAFYKKKVVKIAIIAVFIAMVGMFVLNFDLSNPGSFIVFTIGDFYILLSAIFFALQIVFTEKYIGKIKDLKMFSFIQIFIVASICFILALFDISVYNIPPVETWFWLLWIYLGIGATTLPFIFQNYGQKYVESTQVSLIISLEPIWGTIFGILIAHEEITIQFIIGALLILSASILAIRQNQPTEKKEN